MTFYWTDRIVKIRNGFNTLQFNDNVDIESSSDRYIYPYEYLKTLSAKDLNILLRKRSLEIQGTKEDKILRIQRYHIARLTPICQDETTHIFHVHTTYKLTDYLKDIKLPATGDEEQLIKLLCGIESLNTGKIVCTNLLDRKIKESPKTLDLDTYVYRGIGDPALIYIQDCIDDRKVKSRCKSTDGVFLPALNTRNYSSTSLKISKASTFTQSNCCILKFKIPENVDYLDTTKLSRKDGFEKIDRLYEVLLQRNISYYEFKHIGEYKEKIVIECEILPLAMTDINYDREIQFN